MCDGTLLVTNTGRRGYLKCSCQSILTWVWQRHRTRWRLMQWWRRTRIDWHLHGYST